MIRLRWCYYMAAGWLLTQIFRDSTPGWALPYVGFYAHDTGLRDYCERREQGQ